MTYSVPMHWQRVEVFRQFVSSADYVIQHRGDDGVINTLWRGSALNLTAAWEWGHGFYAARITDGANDGRHRQIGTHQESPSGASEEAGEAVGEGEGRSD